VFCENAIKTVPDDANDGYQYCVKSSATAIKKKPPQNGTHESEFSRFGIKFGKIVKLKKAIIGGKISFGARKLIMSILRSSPVHSSSYKPAANSITPRISIKTINPQVLMFSNAGLCKF
jgi:hypothetical protein